MERKVLTRPKLQTVTYFFLPLHIPKREANSFSAEKQDLYQECLKDTCRLLGQCKKHLVLSSARPHTFGLTS